MDMAKVFVSGNSQAVRLPKNYRFDDKEVYIKRLDMGVLLMPKSKNSVWNTWEKNLAKYDNPIDIERNQPQQQVREGLDEIFD